MSAETNNNKHAWNAFVLGHPLGSVLQTWEWGELKSQFGWKMHPLILGGEKIEGGAMLLSKKLPGTRKRIFYAPRGPLIDFTDQTAAKAFLDKARELIIRENGVLLKVDPEIPEDQANLLTSLGFRRAAREFQPRSTFILDLRPELESILKSFEEKTRYNIRLSAKHGVVVRQISNAEGMDLFYDLHQETAKRDHFLVYTRSYYQKVRELVVEQKRGQIFIAFYQDRPVAGVVIFTLGKKLWYLYGASKSEARNVMPNHALHWNVIQWAKQNGFEVYDLWGIPANPTPDHPLWGVYRFKKGFNGKLVKWVGCYDYIIDPFWFFVFEKALVAYKNLISLVKKGKISDSLGE